LQLLFASAPKNKDGGKNEESRQITEISMENKESR
jgi:hypothetical protein